MPYTARVLVVAHQTAATQPLLDAVRKRAQGGPVEFHLVVPRQPHGMDKVANPHETGEEPAQAVPDDPPPVVAGAAGGEASGNPGAHEQLMAVEHALTQIHRYDDIIISTLPPG